MDENAPKEATTPQASPADQPALNPAEAQEPIEQLTQEPIAQLPVEGPAPVVSQEKPQKNRRTLILLILTLFIIAVGAFVLILSSNPSPQPNNQTTTPENEPTEDGLETSITDRNLIDDLDYKVAALLEQANNANQGTNIFAVPALYSHIELLFKDFAWRESSLSAITDEEWQQRVAIESKLAKMDTSTDTAVIKKTIEANYPERFKAYSSDIIRALDQQEGKHALYAQANASYKELFGKNEDLPMKDVDGLPCTTYCYIPELEQYYAITVPACGGAGFPWVFIKNESYSKRSDEAYANVRVITAQHNLDDGCYVFYNGYNDPKNLAIIRKAEGTFHVASFTANDVTDEDFTNAESYRFVFKKSDSGNYYFNRLERLN